MLFAYTFTFALINISTEFKLLEIDQNSSIPIKTVQPANMCESCVFEVLLKPLDGAFLPDSYNTVTVNGCLQTTFRCKVPGGEICEIAAYGTNNETETMVSLGTGSRIALVTNITCGPSGFYLHSGIELGGLYCTTHNCVL